MRPEEKKYIIANAGKKSIRRIADELGVKERKVRRFIEKSRAADKAASHKPRAKETAIRGKNALISVVLIIILGVAAYANSLDARFSWDDRALVEENVYIRDWGKLPNIFTENIGAGAGERYNFYRPVQMITYMIDYSLWKLNPRGYHITNILLHILAALALYRLAAMLFENKFIPVFAGLLFVAHPIHTEAVTYISGRSDSLAAVFILLSLIFYLKYLREGKANFYALALSGYALALLSRESSLIFPALVLLLCYTAKERVKANAFLPVCGITVFYILLRFTVLKAILENSSFSTTMFQRLPGFFVALAGYLKLMVIPVGLHMEYGDRLFSITDPRAIAGIAIMAALLIAAFKSRKKGTGYFFENDKAGKSSLSPFFALMWFIITLLPVSNLYPLNAYMAEHWLYLPSMGFFLLLAWGIGLLWRKIRPAAIISLAFLLAFYVYLTVKQNDYWKSPLALYERTLEFSPDSPRLHNNLSAAYHRLGRYEDAIAIYKKIIEANPGYSKLYKTYNNLGVAYHDTGKYKEALEIYNKALALRPDYPDMHYNIGLVYRDMGRFAEAAASYKRAIDINPASADADMYNALGIAYSEMGRFENAEASFKKAMQIEPTYADPRDNLKILYEKIGEKN